MHMDGLVFVEVNAGHSYSRKSNVQTQGANIKNAVTVERVNAT